LSSVSDIRNVTNLLKWKIITKNNEWHGSHLASDSGGSAGGSIYSQ